VTITEIFRGEGLWLLRATTLTDDGFALPFGNP
jgi:hypothetical protein